MSRDDTLDIDNYWGNLSLVVHDDERLAELTRLSDAATPGPWVRAYASYDVHHMGIGGGGPGALRSMEDIDFAVACVSFVREMLLERFDILDVAIDHEPGPSVELIAPEQNARRGW